jgi:hypothetical protein
MKHLLRLAILVLFLSLILTACTTPAPADNTAAEATSEATEEGGEDQPVRLRKRVAKEEMTRRQQRVKPLPDTGFTTSQTGS